MNKLRVRVYNVLFGDAILISVPDAAPGESPALRHILIDVGNSLVTEGGEDSVFKKVVADVLTELAGQPLDLYIMTHEHMDHVQGLQYYQTKVLHGQPIKDKLQTRYAWLTRSAHPDYYTPGTPGYHPNAKERKRLEQVFLDEAREYFQAAPDEQTDWVRGLLAINNPRKTDDCVSILRDLAPAHTHYIYRGMDLNGTHPFREATFEIWAPEEDTATYYGQFHPVAFGAVAGIGPSGKPALARVEPPRGVDAGAFYNLLDWRRRGYGDNLLSIDSAANNTSIVFCLNWRGWSLLFPGDAEVRSWKEINKRSLVKSVHFLKISHHGSITGMPPEDVLGELLKADGTRRYVALSAYPDLEKQARGEQEWTYPEVPRQEVLGKLKSRADLQQTIQVADGGYIEYAFAGGTSNVTIGTSG
ncbi:MAG: hypothetical protein GXY76_02715 [Chloroflexi bacterium]|nr:hypothetical protein [Chloroflexota bacterium]